MLNINSPSVQSMLQNLSEAEKNKLNFYNGRSPTISAIDIGELDDNMVNRMYDNSPSFFDLPTMQGGENEMRMLNELTVENSNFNNIPTAPQINSYNQNYMNNQNYPSPMSNGYMFNNPQYAQQIQMQNHLKKLQQKEMLENYYAAVDNGSINPYINSACSNGNQLSVEDAYKARASFLGNKYYGNRATVFIPFEDLTTKKESPSVMSQLVRFEPNNYKENIEKEFSEIRHEIENNVPKTNNFNLSNNNVFQPHLANSYSFPAQTNNSYLPSMNNYTTSNVSPSMPMNNYNMPSLNPSMYNAYPTYQHQPILNSNSNLIPSMYSSDRAQNISSSDFSFSPNQLHSLNQINNPGSMNSFGAFGMASNANPYGYRRFYAKKQPSNKYSMDNLCGWDPSIVASFNMKQAQQDHIKNQSEIMKDFSRAARAATGKCFKDPEKEEEYLNNTYKPQFGEDLEEKMYREAYARYQKEKEKYSTLKVSVQKGDEIFRVDDRRIDYDEMFRKQEYIQNNSQYFINCNPSVIMNKARIKALQVFNKVILPDHISPHEFTARINTLEANDKINNIIYKQQTEGLFDAETFNMGLCDEVGNFAPMAGEKIQNTPKLFGDSNNQNLFLSSNDKDLEKQKIKIAKSIFGKSDVIEIDDDGVIHPIIPKSLQNKLGITTNNCKDNRDIVEQFEKGKVDRKKVNNHFDNFINQITSSFEQEFVNKEEEIKLFGKKHQ